MPSGDAQASPEARVLAGRGAPGKLCVLPGRGAPVTRHFVIKGEVVPTRGIEPRTY